MIIGKLIGKTIRLVIQWLFYWGGGGQKAPVVGFVLPVLGYEIWDLWGGGGKEPKTSAGYNAIEINLQNSSFLQENWSP